MAGEERPDMADGDDATFATRAQATAGGNATDAPEPALQVIILGSQGGPLETNCTAFLVRSIAAGWRKGSIMAVDAGVHLGAIHRILQDTQPPELGKTDDYSLPYILRAGPFAGLKVHSASAKTNAQKIQGDLIDTYLITHPHLDHISGFVINTAGLAGPRRKKLAGLPGTVQALKTHVFNNVIWPNLSDEDHGAGLFTYMRLNEGGSPAMGNPDGYLEFNEGLAVKVWSVSHGHSIDPPRSSQQRIGSGSNTRYGSLDASSGVGSLPIYTGMLSPRSIAHHNASPGLINLFHHQQQQQQQHQQQSVLAHERANSLLPLPSMSSSVAGMGRAPPSMNLSGGHSPTEMHCVYDSSSYFIRDVETGVEVLIFGDVEADSISFHPRNLRIWQEAAPKIVARQLKAILIECSYDDSRPVERLFGHLTPRFLVQEIAVLAEEVKAARAQAVLDKAREAEEPRRGGKRKRDGGDEGTFMGRRRATRAATREFHRGDSLTATGEEPVSPRTMKAAAAAAAGQQLPDGDTTTTSTSQQRNSSMPLTLRETGRSYTGDSSLSPGTSIPHAANFPPPAPPQEDERAQLEGVKVVIIHMKDTMDDEPPIGELILEELREHEAVLAEEDGVGGGKGLGCEWIISDVGMSLML